MKWGVRQLSLLVLVWVLTFFTSIPDYDLWTRLAVGSVFFQTGHVLRHDVFSYLPTKALWVDHEWGSGVVFYLFTRCFGNTGVFILKGLLIYLIFLMVSKTIRLPNAKLAPSALFFALLGYAIFPGVASLIRSQMFTYLLFTIWIYALERVRMNEAKAGMKDRRMYLLFPCTMLFWVNVHGGFVAGVGLVLLYALGELLNRKSPLPYLGIAASILPVMLINPYGVALLRSVVEAALMERPFIPEWHPVSLSGPMQSLGAIHVHFLAGFMIVVGLTAAAACRCLVVRQRGTGPRSPCWSRPSCWPCDTNATWSSSCWPPPRWLTNQSWRCWSPLRRVLDERTPRWSNKTQDVARWVLGYGAPAVVVLLIIPRLQYRVVVDYRRFPVGSLEFIRQNNLSGNLATAFDFGSFAEWKLYPQCKTMIDGRYEEVFPNDVFDLAMRLSVRQGQWWEVVNRFPTDIVVLPKQGYSVADLPSLRGWKPVYQDHVSVVLLPVEKIHGPYVRPDYMSGAYANEDFARPIILAGP